MCVHRIRMISDNKDCRVHADALTLPELPPGTGRLPLLVHVESTESVHIIDPAMEVIIHRILAVTVDTSEDRIRERLHIYKVLSGDDTDTHDDMQGS